MSEETNALGIAREEAEALAGSVPKGQRWAATQWTFRLGGTTYLVKDNRYSNFLHRFAIGHFLMGRERRNYRRMEGLPFVPSFYGRLDRDALILGKAEASPLKRVPETEVPRGFFRDLEECIEVLHGRGIVHLDLRQGGNILVRASGEPLLVDFESALYLSRSHLIRRFLVRLLGWIDHSAVLKLRLRYQPGDLTEADLKRYHRYRRIRALWPVHRGGALWRLRRRPRDKAKGKAEVPSVK